MIYPLRCGMGTTHPLRYGKVIYHSYFRVWQGYHSPLECCKDIYPTTYSLGCGWGTYCSPLLARWERGGNWHRWTEVKMDSLSGKDPEPSQDAEQTSEDKVSITAKRLMSLKRNPECHHKTSGEVTSGQYCIHQGLQGVKVKTHLENICLTVSRVSFLGTRSWTFVFPAQTI